MALARSRFPRRWNGVRHRYRRAPSSKNELVLRGGYLLGKRDEVAAGVLDAEFFHAVKGSTDGHDDFHVFHGRQHGVEIAHLDIKIGGTLSGLRGHGWRRV